MKTHPLTLPEIVLCIGMHIQIWFPVSPKRNNECLEYLFEPDDIVAAIAVNRPFHATLTSLLWTVYSETVFNPRGFKDHSTYPTATIFRFLELSAQVLPMPMFQQSAMPQFQNCTHLQELKLSQFVDPDWAARLIQANPNLSLLDWGYPDEDFFIAYQGRVPLEDPDGYRDLRHLSCLQRLRTLRLENWKLHPLYLYHILEKTTEYLEELNLTGGCCIMEDSIFNTTTTRLDKAGLLEMTEADQAEAVGLVPKRPLSLPQLKILDLDLDLWDSSSNRPICDLVRAMPALEILVVLPDFNWAFLTLSQTLRQSCPRLSSIQYIREPWAAEYRYPATSEFVIALLESAVPGNLVHFKMPIQVLDDSATTALLAHQDRLETLELDFPGNENRTSKNLGRILGQCWRLKRLSCRDTEYNWGLEDVEPFLTAPWMCRELEIQEPSGFCSTLLMMTLTTTWMDLT
ncbi:hypothetical protein BGX33_007449 [Mortierella sp. NVP41]|nr:hypothetical protein BGX33_007449 [Mortierella sp. NVP41]